MAKTEGIGNGNRTGGTRQIRPLGQSPLQGFNSRIETLLKRLKDIILGRNYNLMSQIVGATNRISEYEMGMPRTRDLTTSIVTEGTFIGSPSRLFPDYLISINNDALLLLEFQITELASIASDIMAVGKSKVEVENQPSRTRLAKAIEVISRTVTLLEEAKNGLPQDAEEALSKIIVIHGETANKFRSRIDAMDSAAKSSPIYAFDDLNPQARSSVLIALREVILFLRDSLALMDKIYAACHPSTDSNKPSNSELGNSILALGITYNRIIRIISPASA